ncbi:MAG: efflux RND transporter periplasmic adaptor subunit [Anaerolineae bacterium]
MTTDTSAATPEQKKFLFSNRRVWLVGLGLLIILVGAIAVGYYYWRSTTLFVTTDDALIDSNMTAVAAPGTGTLRSWRVEPGMQVQAGQTIGFVKPAPSASSHSSFPVTAPVDGTVIRVDGTEGQVIGAAQPLAYVADLNHLTVTAFIDEADIHRVQPGQRVEVTVDADSNKKFSGTVKEIIPATASEFALLQTIDRTTANFTKVAQRIEVHIDLGSTADSGLYPGMSAYIRIHLQEKGNLIATEAQRQ